MTKIAKTQDIALKKIKTPQNIVVFLSGGESEIRTLEPFYRLHDFQPVPCGQNKRYFARINHARVREKKR